jgi:hypothetical protein
MRTRLFLSSNKYLSPELGWFSDKRPGNRQTAFLTIVAELVRCSPLDSGVRSGSSSDRLVAHLPDRGQATLTAGTSAAIVGPQAKTGCLGLCGRRGWHLSDRGQAAARHVGGECGAKPRPPTFTGPCARRSHPPGAVSQWGERRTDVVNVMAQHSLPRTPY